MRLSNKERAELCFAVVVPCAVYLLIAIAAHGISQGWW